MFMTALIERSPSVVKSITLRNGVTLQYVEHGEPTGVPVVLLHGYSDSWRSYEPVLPYLPPSIRAFAVTQRGHGDSDRPESGYAPRDFAVDVAQFADALGLTRLILVGHSMGSTIAQRFAIDDPDRTLGVVLIGSFVDFAGNPAVAGLRDVVASFTDPVDPAFIREFQESTFARPVASDFLELVISESAKLPARVWKAVSDGFLTTNLAAELPKLTAPALVIWGDQDPYVDRSEQELIASTAPNARLEVYAGAGHAVHWEEPARVATDIAAFVESIRSVPA